MPVRFTCAECQFQANVKDELSGKKIKCPKCQAAGIVGVGAAAAVAAVAKKAKKSVPDDDANPFAALGDPSKFGTEIDPEDEDYEELMAEIAPKKKKKSAGPKKPKEPAEEGMNSSVLVLVALFALGGLGAIGAGVYYTMPNLMGSSVVEAPKQLKKFHHLHGAFYVELPDGDGWVVTESENKPGIPDWIKCVKGSVEIKVMEDEKGALIARTTAMGGNATDMANTFGTSATVNPSDPAMSRTLFDRLKENHEKNYSAYEEGSVKKFSCDYGDGRMAEFSYKSGFSATKGIRAMLVGGQSPYEVICSCPEANFASMKPVFEKVIASMEDVELTFQ
jgi:hypothetical protein